MFLFTKDEKLQSNEPEEYESLKNLLLENSEEISYAEGRVFEWEHDENVRLGITFCDTDLAIEFWVEVKSHVPYFGDDSKNLQPDEILKEMESINLSISDFIKEYFVSDDELNALTALMQLHSGRC